MQLDVFQQKGYGREEFEFPTLSLAGESEMTWLFLYIILYYTIAFEKERTAAINV